jgi:hypothetical protein
MRARNGRAYCFQLELLEDRVALGGGLSALSSLPSPHKNPRLPADPIADSSGPSPLMAASAQDNGKREAGQGQYAQLTAEWWQWALSQPVSTSPLLDETGANAAVGQAANGHPPGSVFFLAGAFAEAGTPFSATAERTIIVPASTALFFPILNTLSAPDPGTNPGHATIPQSRTAIAEMMDTATDLHVTLNGTSLSGLITRVKSPTFDFTLPEDNIFGIGAGVIKHAVSDGYYVYIPPLPPGHYDLNFGGTLVNPNGTTFTLDITYHITVQ